MDREDGGSSTSATGWTVDLELVLLNLDLVTELFC